VTRPVITGGEAVWPSAGREQKPLQKIFDDLNGICV
jgi:hypothetical protein